MSARLGRCRACDGSRRGQRGAAYVEVLVIVGVVVVIGLAAVLALGRASSEHAEREAACILSFGCSSGAGGSSGGGDLSAVVGAPSAATPAAATVESPDARQDRLIAALQAGQRLSQADIDFLQSRNDEPHRGLITASVGANVSIRSPEYYGRAGVEANTDRGLYGSIRGGNTGTLGRVKIDGNVEATTQGTERGAVSAELPVFERRLGPARAGIALGAEQQTNGNQSAYVKGSADVRAQVPYLGEARAEVYARIAVNRLTEQESRLIEAGMAARAAQMGNDRADRMALFLYNRERVLRGLPPVDRIPHPGS